MVVEPLPTYNTNSVSDIAKGTLVGQNRPAPQLRTTDITNPTFFKSFISSRRTNQINKHILQLKQHYITTPTQRHTQTRTQHTHTRVCTQTHTHNTWHSIFKKMLTHSTECFIQNILGDVANEKLTNVDVFHFFYCSTTPCPTQTLPSCSSDLNSLNGTSYRDENLSVFLSLTRGRLEIAPARAPSQ